MIDGVVTFSGTATGTIEVSVASNGTATFVLGSITATVPSIAGKAIQLATGQTLALSAADVGELTGVALKGTGTIKATEALSIAQLTALQSDGAWTGTLAYTAVADTAAHLNADGGLYAKNVAITISGAATLAELAAINSHKGTGSLVYTQVSDTAAELASNTDGFVSGAVNITVLDVASVAQLAAIDALTTGTVSAQQLEDTVANLYPQGVRSAYVTAGVQVNLLDAASLMQWMEISGVIGSGNLVFTAIADTASHLLNFLEGGNVELPVGTAVTVAGNNAGALSMQEVRDLKLITTDDSWTYSLEDSAANLRADVPTLMGASAVAVKNASIGDVSNISSYPAKFVTAKELIDSAATLFYGGTLSAYVVSGTKVTVTDAVSIAQLQAIRTRIGEDAELDISTITDTAANLLAYTGDLQAFDGAAVTLTGGSTVAQMAALLPLMEDSSWTYSLADTLDNLQAQGAAGLIAGATGVTVTGNGGQGLTLAEVTALVTQLPGGVWTYSLTDSADKLLALATNASLITSATSVSVTGNAAGTLTLANVSTLLALTTVDDWTYSLQDSPANLSLASTAIVGGAAAIKLSGNATVAQIVSITNKSSAPITYLLADTRANIDSASNPLVSGASFIVVTDTATIAQLGAIDARTDAGMRGNIVADTAAHIFTETGVAYLGKNGDVTVTDAISIGQINWAKTVLDIGLGKGKLTFTAITDTARTLLDANAKGFGFGSKTVTVLGNVARDIAVEEVDILRGVTTNDSWTYSLMDTADALLDSANNTIFQAAISYAVWDASIADLIDIEAIATKPVTAKEVVDSAAHLFAGGALSDYVIAGIEVKVTDAITIAQLQALRTCLGQTGELKFDDISDTAAHLLAHLEAYKLDHSGALENFENATVTLTDAVTVAQLNELLTLTDNSDWDYRLADTLANLQNPSAANAVDDAMSYALTDAPATLVNLDSGQRTFVEGASNAASYDVEAPTLASVTGNGTQVVLTFSEDIQAGSGNIVIKASGGSIVATIAVDSLQISGKTLTLPTTLTLGTPYSIEVVQGAVKDTTGNDFAGIASTDATVGFTAAASVFDVILVSGEGTGQELYRVVGDGTVTVTGSFDHRYQTSNYTFTPQQGTAKTVSFQGDLQLQIDAPLTLKGDAETLSEMSISGTGTVAITKLEESFNAYFSAIETSVVTADFAAGAQDQVSLDSGANLGKAEITISSGTLDVGSATLGTASFEVTAGAGLKGEADQLSGVAATGAGRVTVDGLDTATDLSGITTTAVNARIESTVNLSTNAQLGTVTEYMVNAGQTVTLIAAQLQNIKASGQGGVAVLASDGAQTLNIQTTGNNTITAGAGADVITLAEDGGTDTLFVKLGAALEFSDSHLGAFDTITNFQIGTDKIDLLTASGDAVGRPTDLVRVADVASSDDLAVALASAFAALTANQAGLVVIEAGTAAGTYLYADNGNGIVDAEVDVFIQLVGVAGFLGDPGNLTVNDFFA